MKVLRVHHRKNEHLNHAWLGGLKRDRVYADAEKNYDTDKAYYLMLKAQGFPIEWKPVLT